MTSPEGAEHTSGAINSKATTTTTTTTTNHNKAPNYAVAMNRAAKSTKIKDLILMDESLSINNEAASNNTSTTTTTASNNVGSASASSAPLAAYRVVTTTNPASPPVQTVLTSPINGQFYVIGTASDVLGPASVNSPRAIAPRGNILTATAAPVAVADPMTAGSATVATVSTTLPKDERRRATHNEVERRRRDNINTGIQRLSKLIPPEPSGGLLSTVDGTGGGKSGSTRSKGDILARACEYVKDLKQENTRLREQLSSQESQKELESLREENELLKEALEANGVILPTALNTRKTQPST